MYRLFSAVPLSVAVALVWAATGSPSFNAALSSPTLVRSLSADYELVDQQYGNITNPVDIQIALSRLMPPNVAPSDSSLDLTGSEVTLLRSADGVNRAREAEEAAAALGTTAELAPARRELLNSFQEAEQAWVAEGKVERVLAKTDGTRASLDALLPTAEPSATDSEQAIQYAQELHDQAMAIVAALDGGPYPLKLNPGFINAGDSVGGRIGATVTSDGKR